MARVAQVHLSAHADTAQQEAVHRSIGYVADEDEPFQVLRPPSASYIYIYILKFELERRTRFS